MATYIIGDLHGCYDELLQLLQLINYNSKTDRLLFAGDLVNGGRKSKECLEFVMQLCDIPGNDCVIGNHDLTLLGALMGYFNFPKNREIGVEDVLRTKDTSSYINWLLKRPFLVDLPEFNMLLVHAGIYPKWDLTTAKFFAKKIEDALNSDLIDLIMPNIDNREYVSVNDNSTDLEQILFAINAFTRMRFCDHTLKINLDRKGTVDRESADLTPWYLLLNLETVNRSVVFGHWASLKQKNFMPNAICVDYGCVWGEQLSALCLDDMLIHTVPANPDFKDKRIYD